MSDLAIVIHATHLSSQRLIIDGQVGLLRLWPR